MGSPGGTNEPTLLVITSGIPPTLLPTQGVPHASASINTTP